MAGNFNIVLPGLQPVGGVVKCMDYAVHAESIGLSVRIFSPESPRSANKLFRRKDFARLRDGGASFHSRYELAFEPESIYFFSLPSDFESIEPLMRSGLEPGNIIHIIQNTRHAASWFENGYAIRLLSRPMRRIAISKIVSDAIKPFVNPDSECKVIPLGHKADYFSKYRRSGFKSPLRIGYTSWKSDFGHRLRDIFSGDRRFVFKSIDEFVNWPTLRKFYSSIDVFVGTPLEKEGFYLPGLEAMAAGCIVLMPDAEGNLAYCNYGENCIFYELENVESARKAIIDIRDAETSQIQSIRTSANNTVEEFSLENERRLFAQFVGGPEKMAASRPEVALNRPAVNF